MFKSFYIDSLLVASAGANKEFYVQEVVSTMCWDQANMTLRRLEEDSICKKFVTKHSQFRVTL
jgi:hypothetical protein